MLLLFLLSVLLSGAGIAAAFFSRNNRPAIAGSAMPLGLMALLGIRLLPGMAGRPWASVFVLIALSAIIVALSSMRNSNKVQAPCTFSPQDWLLWAATVLFWGFFLGTFVGNDEINHFFHAAQICNGKFPPSGFSFVDFPVKYHYGWDILLADLKMIGNLDFSYGSDLLMWLFVASNALVLLTILKRNTPVFRYYAIGFVAFFYGSGILWLLASGSFLTSIAMYNQHAWTFSASVLLFGILFFQDGADAALRFRLPLILLLMLAAPLYSAHSILLWGLFLLFAGGWAWASKDRRQGLMDFAAAGLTGLAALLIWRWLNRGILVSGEAYDQPVYRFAITLFGWKNYLRYEGSYLLMTPATLLVLAAIVFKLARNRLAVFRTYNPGTLFAAWCVLLCYPLPLLFLVENSSYWDNFCKFNYIGVLAGWILFPYLLQALEKLKRPWNLVICGAILLAVFSAFIRDCFRPTWYVVPYTRHADWERGDIPRLTAKMRTLSDGAILLIAPAVREHYQVDPKTNKAQVNLYGYIAEHYQRFVPLAVTAGRPILNFYDYNFMYNRKLEYRQAELLDQLYRGNYEVLAELNAAYVISDYVCPAYLDAAERNGLLSLLGSDPDENWRLFRVMKPVVSQSASQSLRSEK